MSSSRSSAADLILYTQIGGGTGSFKNDIWRDITNRWRHWAQIGGSTGRKLQSNRWRRHRSFKHDTWCEITQISGDTIEASNTFVWRYTIRWRHCIGILQTQHLVLHYWTRYDGRGGGDVGHRDEEKMEDETTKEGGGGEGRRRVVLPHTTRGLCRRFLGLFRRLLRMRWLLSLVLLGFYTCGSNINGSTGVSAHGKMEGWNLADINVNEHQNDHMYTFLISQI